MVFQMAMVVVNGRGRPGYARLPGSTRAAELGLRRRGAVAMFDFDVLEEQFEERDEVRTRRLAPLPGPAMTRGRSSYVQLTGAPDLLVNHQAFKW